MKLRKIFFTFSFCFFFAKSASAEVFFDIRNEENQKTKILFFGFNSQDQDLNQDAYEIYDRIERNLLTTNLFQIAADTNLLQTADSKSIMSPLRTPPAALSEFDENSGKEIKKPALPLVSVEMLPNFDAYNKMKISAIVVAQMNYNIEGNLEIRVRMWDILDQRQLFGKFYSTSKDNYKKIANTISDEVFKAITGEKKGHFDSKIVYVSESGSAKKRTKKIAIMDYDGENKTFLTGGGDLVLTPVFAKNPNEIFYLRYYQNRPQIFKLNIANMHHKQLGQFGATTLAASPHPTDHNRVLLSAIFEGNTDIYELYINDNRASRLSKSPAIDINASYSPDGNDIIFISDRDLGQQIYIMTNDGRDVRRLTSGTGSYASPIYSPDGKMIAFTRIKNGQFYVGTMSANGRNERLLTSGYMVEGAKFSPNGRYLIYSKKRTAYGKGSIPALYVIDIATGFERELPLEKGEGATDPDWI